MGAADQSDFCSAGALTLDAQTRDTRIDVSVLERKWCDARLEKAAPAPVRATPDPTANLRFRPDLR
jgi:hypothetical protein